MKEKSPIEKNAERKQIDLLSEALNGASNANGYWLNASGKGYPKFHPRGVSVSPFNALFMALHSDKNGCGSNLFIHYNEAKAMGMHANQLAPLDLKSTMKVATAGVTGVDPMTSVHVRNWMECIRSGEKTNAPVEAAYDHSSACIMVNAALRTKQYVTFDEEHQEVLAGGKVFKF